MKEEIHKELAALQEELVRLRDAAQHISDAKELAERLTSNGENLRSKYEEHIHAAINLTAQYQELALRTDALVEKIEKVDFPVRLDKLDANVAGIVQVSQTTQLRLENMGHDLRDQLTEMRVVIQSAAKESIQQNKFIRMLIIITLVIGLALIGFDMFSVMH
ncbi:hypothetical protein JNL27_10015 [bacterium]|nr:hypothetical protein [bacterium]